MANKILVIAKSEKYKKIVSKNLVSFYKNFLDGFYVDKIVEESKIVGYRINSFKNESEILAAKNFLSRIYFNKYGVNMKAIDEFAVKCCDGNNTLFIDELGPIFLLSKKFMDLIIRVLSSDKKIVCFSKNVNEIKATFNALDDSQIIEITEKNYLQLQKYLEDWIGRNLIVGENYGNFRNS
jgi:nucleoside-triphosphatase THEP1